MRIHRLLRHQPAFYSFCLAKLNIPPMPQVTTVPISTLKDKLVNTKTHIEHLLSVLPSEIDDGTNFSNLYDGVIIRMKELVARTSDVIVKLENQPTVNAESVEISYKYIDQLMEKYADAAIESKNNDFKLGIMRFDMKLSVVMDMMDRILDPSDGEPLYLSIQRMDQLISKYGKVMKTNVGAIDMDRQLDRIRKVLEATNASVIYGEKYKYKLQKDVMFLYNVPRSIYKSYKASVVSTKLYKNPSIDILAKIWNSGQTGWKGFMLALGLRFLYPVTTNTMIYLPRGQSKDGEITQNILKSQNDRISVQVLIDKAQQIHEYMPVDDYHVVEPYDAIIIHIHGGGFVALSSLTVQSYTRRWARQTRVPVFSINYRHAPKHPFPAALEDVHQAYMFIINHIHQHSNIRFKKVIVTGDSAGGNLACALTGLLLKNKQPAPDCLLLAYPSLDLRYVFSRSRVFSFNDPLLFSSLLVQIRQAYIGSASDDNPLVSPIFLNEKFVTGQGSEETWPQKWPMTHLMVGNRDPLYDDSLRLLDKMDQASIPAKITVMDGLGHGFLSLDVPIPACKLAISQSIQALKDLSK